MKARTLVLMLCISLMCFTGFGATTADLTEDSQTEIVHMDHSVTVVAVTDQIQDLSFTGVQVTPHFYSVLNTDMYSYVASGITRLQDAAFHNSIDNSINPVLDVGWYTSQKDILTPDIQRDPGGVLSLFYS